MCSQQEVIGHQESREELCHKEPGAFLAWGWKGEMGAGGCILDTGVNVHTALGWYSWRDKNQKQFKSVQSYCTRL